MNRLALCASKISPRVISKKLHIQAAPSKLLVPSITHGFTRQIQRSSKNIPLPRTPDLIYMPRFFRWLKSKLRIKYLQNFWDPEFSEGAFIYGSTRAVCRISEIIYSGNTKELEGLMTTSARFKLLNDINYRLSEAQKDLILLRPEDVKILVPTDVQLSRDGRRKLCRIALKVLALKWHQEPDSLFKLVLVALQSEFVRDYGEDAAREWLMSDFSVLECTKVSQINAH